MREIRLNGTQYKLAPGSTIIKRAINPWKAAIRSGTGLEYSSFQNAELEEYFDFRNGIGKKRGVGSDARLDWSEGIDFATEGQAVLGPLVNTADYDDWEASHNYALLNFVIPTTPNGYCYECTTDAGSSAATPQPTWPTTVGNTVVDDGITWTCRAYLAPIKIIDFKGDDSTKKTYVIQNSRILKWDGTNLDCVDNTFADPIDAIVVTDGTDEYLIVSSASDAIYTTDGATWTAYPVGWVSPTGFTDADNGWTGETNVYDGDTATKSDCAAAAKYLELTFAESIFTDRCRIWGSAHNANIDFYYEGGWHDVFDLPLTGGEWETKTNSAGVKLVEKVRIESADGASFDLFEFDLGRIMLGYLADYDNRLYCISTDGRSVIYSTAKDVDDPTGEFELTGNFGTVYDLFEGKLLADGTATLYFCGTEGTFTIDTTNEKQYQQEVAYPPLTYAGHVGKYWNANVWVATGYGILKVTPSMATFVGPDQDDGLPSDYQGYIYDMVTVNNWLVYCVNGGTTDRSSILKRNSSLGGNLQVFTCGYHKAADTTDTISATDASNQATLDTLLNEIKTDYNTHIASTTYHVAADSTNAITSTNSSSLATALTLVNEIKTDYNAHRILSGVHLGTDPDNEITSATATNLATAITLANEIKADFNIHILSAGGAIACLHHSPSSLYTNGRLWFGEGTGVKYMMFPDITSNVKQVSGYQYVNDSGYGKLPIFRKLAAIPKVALGVAAITKSCDTDDYVEVYYGLNGAAPTNLIGTFNDSPRDDIATFGSDLGTAFYTIQFAIKIIRNGGNTTSPELESLMFYWYATPVRISAWAFDILATGDDADAIFTAFEAIYDTNTLVAFYPSGDPAKTSYNVKLTQMPSREWWEEQGAREGHFQAVVEEIFKG